MQKKIFFFDFFPITDHLSFSLYIQSASKQRMECLRARKCAYRAGFCDAGTAVGMSSGGARNKSAGKGKGGIEMEIVGSVYHQLRRQWALSWELRRHKQ